jgi:hypothetical protein
MYLDTCGGPVWNRVVSDRAESNGLGAAAIQIARLSPGRPRYRGPACDATTRQSPTDILGEPSRQSLRAVSVESYMSAPGQGPAMSLKGCDRHHTGLK